MKLLIPAPKKRNPLVPAALQRLAGPHRPSRKKARQDAAADLRSRLVEKDRG